MRASRLPGKVLRPLAGEPMLGQLIRRVLRAQLVDTVLVATTVDSADDPIVAVAEEFGASVFRGSEQDVLGRVLGAARSVSADWIVELTGDNPMVDPDVIDALVAVYAEGGFDYVANLPQRTFPLGMDVQVFAVNTLAEIDRLTADPFDREHVTTYIYRHPDRYRLYCLPCDPRLARPNFRLTVDEEPDFELASRIYDYFLPEKPDFRLADLVALLDSKPDWVAHNVSIQHRWVDGV